MRPSSSFTISQNFLRDPSLVDTLIARAGLHSGELVLDLGAGSGAITARLLRRGCRVVAVEADPCLGRQLRQRFGPAVEVRVQRIVDCELPREPYRVFANIPFTITAEVIHLLTDAARPPGDACLVVQREAARRFLGRPHPTLVAALLAPWFALSVEHHFRSTDFVPKPSVEAVLLRLRKRGPPLVRDDRRRDFGDFVVTLFGAPRTIDTSLRRLLGGDAAYRIRRELQLEPDVRPSQIAVDRWPALFAAFEAGASRETRRCLSGAAARLERQQSRLHKRHRTRVPHRQVRPGETSAVRPPPRARSAHPYNGAPCWGRRSSSGGSPSARRPRCARSNRGSTPPAPACPGSCGVGRGGRAYG
ncbi:MAG: hypothetical protein JO023_24865 [Chloroflexi bacterium]|nr:hypothetical protein [Chloroflexota bacterium]